jgi:hypothetical protein
MLLTALLVAFHESRLLASMFHLKPFMPPSDHQNSTTILEICRYRGTVVGLIGRYDHASEWPKLNGILTSRNSRQIGYRVTITGQSRHKASTSERAKTLVTEFGAYWRYLGCVNVRGLNLAYSLKVKHEKSS